MNRYSINSASLGVGYSTANQYFTATGLLRLIDTTLDFSVSKALSAAISFTLTSAEELGVQVRMGAENALLTLAGANTMGVNRLALMPSVAQDLLLQSAASLTVNVALQANGLLTFVGPDDMDAWLANWLAGGTTLTLVGTGDFYDGPRTPAPSERTAGIVDLSTTERTAGTVSLGA